MARSGTYVPSNEDLLDVYGIEADRLRRHPFGLEGECWIADDRWVATEGPMATEFLGAYQAAIALARVTAANDDRWRVATRRFS